MSTVENAQYIGDRISVRENVAKIASALPLDVIEVVSLVL